MARNAQGINLGFVAQSPGQSCDDTAPTNNLLSGFSMFIEVIDYESTGIDDLSIQGRLKNEELTGPNPILTMGSGKDMIGSEALEVTKHKIADPRSLGGSRLVPPP